MAEDVPDIEAVFFAARQKEPADRTAYLDQVCAGKPELRRRIEQLLSAQAEIGSFLEAPASQAGATIDESLAERPGMMIGQYKLLEQIGEGGFGVVYMAEQQAPVRRKVALKILKPGMDTRQVIARFEAERQALAIMDHPNIARVFDGGATPSGRPYFVMELVKGVPITEFCDQNHLTPRQRLELFIPICHAVQHAHQKGIIHRDLKPSNVLVSRHDTAAVVKVIDFGVAKALGQELTDKTLFTGIAQMVGTPLYMSPEQAGMSDLDIDTRSDIYSLGVLLYELLTGTTPFDKERFKQAAYDEIRRIIREEEPPRPSTRISTLGKAATTVSTQRKSDPKRLSQLFRGELDWIVMRCLEKDRNRRYETAGALAVDVQRYLHDEPVQACPPSAWYRFRKFTRRNKPALAAAIVVVFGVMIAVATLVVSTTAIAQERNDAIQARNKADDLRQVADEQRKLAEKLEKIAKKQQAQAEEREKTTRRYLYAAHMNLAQQAVELPDPPRALRLLRLHQPKPGQEDLRSFEWYYWWRQCHRRLLKTLERHTDSVYAVAFSPDGQTLASGSGDSTVRLWDVASGLERICLTGHKNRVLAVAFSPDGKALASGSRDGTVKLWDVATSTARATLKGHNDWVTSVAFSPDGRTLASASADRSIKLWQVATGKPRKSLRGQQPFLSVAFSPDGRKLASSSRETYFRGGGTLALWDLDAAKARELFAADGDSPASVAFSPDGKTVAAAISLAGVVKVWDVATGELKKTLERGNGLNTVAFSPDGKSLASGGEQRSVIVWDLATGNRQFTFVGHGDFVLAVAFSPDRKTLASASNDRTVKLWDLAAVEPETFLKGHAKPVGTVAFSPDGQTVASAGQDHVINLWNVRSGDLKTTIKGHTAVVTALAFSPSGKTLASASLDRTVKLWDSKTGNLRFALEGPGIIVAEMVVSPVAFSPDGKTVATASQEFAVKLWDAETGAPKGNLKGHRSAVISLAFSPDGKTLASVGSWDHTVRLWDLATGKVKSVLTAEEISMWPFWVAAFSPDGKTLATGGEPASIRLWDVATAKLKGTFPGHASVVWSLAFSPDCKILASGSYDGTIKLWDLATGEPRTTLRGGARIAFSPDGTVLAATTDVGLELFRAATEKDVRGHEGSTTRMKEK
jgi:WD40 repeat protein/serine/threonine protein kinase